ncbi:hypothetical protein OTU49_014875 [Cherax quadricarinatus]|uniref:HTH CENPB-type domain-containing protein n=1 Tax=Cherax quadricarinatus TaxID=27406 RepID=A0AAW0Y107_CHEQU
MPLTGLLVMKQARIYHEELDIEGECQYSGGWLQKFKMRNGVKCLKICDEKADPDGEIAEMVLNTNKHENSSDDGDEDIVNTGEKVPIDNMVKMCDQLIVGLEQGAFISEQEIMAIYSVKERLLRQKPMLIRQMTLEEVFKNAICQSS